MGEHIKRFISCGVPTTVCNFRCSYCYLTCHKNAYSGHMYDFPVPVEQMVQSFSKKRMGGGCYFNMCAAGETTLQKDLLPLIKGLLDEGHYCDIITNGSISKKIDELISMMNEDEGKRLFIKFSFHYLQLKEKGLLDEYVNNVNKIKNSGISYSIEITPHDELVPYINEIKDFSNKNFGFLPHITVARNEATEEIELLTKMTREEYKKIWSVFDSVLFDFKISIFNRKINEFCYAGENSLYVDLGTGEYKSCYCGQYLGNIFKNPESEIKFCAIGKCKLAHCFNGHALIALAGNVPDLKLPIPTYTEERNRISKDGTNSLKKDCYDFFSQSCDKTNGTFDKRKQKQIIRKNFILIPVRTAGAVLRRLKFKLLKKI